MTNKGQQQAKGCLGCFSLICLAVFAGNLGLCGRTASTVPSPTAAHAQREADTMRGFNLGRQIGAKRAREGFPRPSLDYLDSIINLTAPTESAGFRTGFKAGYLDGWEKRDGTPL